MVRLLILLCLSATIVNGQLEWWQKTIVYQVYPRSFMDTDGNGVGDLEGIISKLDYIKSLNIDTVWLSPIYPSPGADMGYDISDYRGIDPLFGDMATFDRLLAETHARGMYLVLDFVPNHSSDEHVWFQRSKESDNNQYSNYYVWRYGKDGGPPNNWLSQFRGSAWEYVASRNQYYLHDFHTKQPDLNYRHPELVNEMKEVLRFWLDKGVDGFRMDIVPLLFEHNDFLDEPKRDPLPPGVDDQDKASLIHIYTEDQPESFEMIQQFREVLDEYRITTPQQPHRVMMTEAYTSVELMAKWYGTAERAGSHLPFNFEFIMNFFSDTPAQKYVDYIARYLTGIPDNRWPDWVIGNHDQRRTPTRYGVNKVDAMNALTLLLPGTAITYMGEELGMEDNTAITYEQGTDPQGCNAGPDRYKDLTRDFERSPFQWDNSTQAGFSSAATTWLPVHANYPNLNVAAQEAATESHLKFYRQVAALRRLDSVIEGPVYAGTFGDMVLVIVRELPGSVNVVAILNLGEFDQGVDLNVVFPGKPFEGYTLYAKSVDSKMEIGAPLAPFFLVPGYDAAIFVNGQV